MEKKNKPGYQTSEFWLMLFSVAAPLFGLPVDAMTAVGAGLYSAARAGYKIWG